MKKGNQNIKDIVRVNLSLLRKLALSIDQDLMNKI